MLIIYDNFTCFIVILDWNIFHLGQQFERQRKNVIYIYIISRDLYNFLLQGMNWNAGDRIEGKGMKKGDFASRHWHGFVS